jgi:acyl-CoA hydrolase
VAKQEPHTIRASRHESSRVMMPLDANPLGNVYGGTIMRFMDEVAAVSAIRHARTNCVTASIERMDFIEPVHIGELLILKAAVIYTGRTSMIVGVKVEAENPVRGRHVMAGKCYLTFVALDKRGKPVQVPPVEPTDDEERRWFERGRKLYELRKALLKAERARHVS